LRAEATIEVFRGPEVTAPTHLGKTP
jgi:hypothetical protein